MSAHIAEAWRDFDARVGEVAAEHPRVTFTGVRDVYGRSSARLLGEDADAVDAARQALVERLADNPPGFLAEPAVGVEASSSRLGKLLTETRRRVAGTDNVFSVERLLANQAWVDPIARSARGDGAPVVAFYSFKGGVGRSTLAAGTALELARRGMSIALVDLDLEAPGIQGFFFPPDGDETPSARAGVVDFLLESRIVGEGYSPDFGDFVIPFTESTIEAKGGRLVIVPAGALDGSYVERLGRVDLSMVGRKGAEHPLGRLFAALRAWRPVDLIVVDCRTGFTDVGGVTLNGLSTVDVLVFKGGPVDRLHLPTVLSHMRRFHDPAERSPEAAEALARSFLPVYTMVEWSARKDEAAAELSELRQFTSEACWAHIFEPFGEVGYVYPELDASDSPVEAVPHDFIAVPYMRDWARTASVVDMVRIQRTHPDGPVDALVDRLLDVKLTLSRDEPPDELGAATPSVREEALRAVADVVGKPTAEEDFTTLVDLQHKFLPRAAYRPLLERSAFIVLGAKGSGKSALFQLLLHPSYLAAVADRISLDKAWATRTEWLDGLADSPSHPALRPDHFVDAFEEADGDHDRIMRFWRAVAAWRIAGHLGEAVAGLASPGDCLLAMSDREVRQAVDGFLGEVNARFEGEGRWLCVCYDRLDVQVSRVLARRGEMLSGLVTAWQDVMSRWPRIRTKIFLREDIWDREIDFDDKAKVRDGIDRARITWDAVDLYRAVIKRLVQSPSMRAVYDEAGLWSARFEEQMKDALGFVPPTDEAWVRPAVEVVAGETMAHGEWGYKRGYVYTWLIKHASDAQDALRPRSLLLLFSRAAQIQGEPSAAGLIGPASIREALRGEVSTAAVDDLRNEFKAEWQTRDGTWIPDTLSTLAKVWPVSEEALLDHLEAVGVDDPSGMLDRMIAGALFERRRRGRPAAVELQIPDVYLYGLGLTRKG